MFRAFRSKTLYTAATDASALSLPLLRKSAGRSGGLAIALATAFLMTGCSGSGGFWGLGSGSNAEPAAPVTPAAPNSVIGNGSTKVALILPLSAPGGAGATAQSLRNAAALAISEFTLSDIQLLVRDDQGTEEGAREATRSALADGAELVLGPLFSGATHVAATVAKPHNKSMISFSTDSKVAEPGVYLLSFLPETEVGRIIRFAAQRGRKSFAALVPDSAYGKVVQAAFQNSVSSLGGRVVTIETYAADRSNLESVIQKLATQTNKYDALFVPDTADALPGIAQHLRNAGIDTAKIKLLGTSMWNDPRVLAAQALQGSWFAGPETAGFHAFAQRYREKFGTDPVRIASLSYDAVSLAAALVRTQGTQRFSAQILTNRAGFAGVDGIFRFNTNGTNDRALAVFEIRQNTPVTISAAPREF